MRLAAITTTSRTNMAAAVAEFQSPMNAGFFASCVIIKGIAVNLVRVQVANFWGQVIPEHPQ